MGSRSRAAIALFIACFSGAGCVTQALTKAIVEAPNQRETPAVLRPESAKRLHRAEETFSAAWTVPVGPPTAALAVAVVEPGDYQLVHAIKTGEFKNGRAPVWPQSDWTLPAKAIRGDPTPKGTILVLHGYQDAKEDMMHWAMYLAQQGYRIVLVDLRGHGHSTGDWIGYGAFEAHDLEQVLDDVQRRGLASGPIGVLGLSYGASVGLQFASRDKRISAVVALEPFSDPRQAVVEFAHAVVPGLVKHWKAADFSAAEDRASLSAHFAWQDADVLKSVGHLSAPVLYVYATHDHWISPENTRLLSTKTASPHAVITVTFADSRIEDHVILSWILDPIAPPIAAWFDECLLRPGQDLEKRLTALGYRS